jgi:hypothetical protein
LAFLDGLQDFPVLIPINDLLFAVRLIPRVDFAVNGQFGGSGREKEVVKFGGGSRHKHFDF